VTRRLAGLLALLLRGGQFGRNGADKTFVARQAEDVIDRIGFEQMVAAARDGNPRVAIRPTSHLAQLSQLGEKNQQYQRRHSESLHYTALAGARVLQYRCSLPSFRRPVTCKYMARDFTPKPKAEKRVGLHYTRFSLIAP